MNLGLVQYSPSWENKKENIRKLNTLLENYQDEYDLLIFPEMSLTGFTMNSDQHCETLNGETKDYFAAAAVKFNSYIIAGVIESDKNNIYNSAIVLDRSGKLISAYRKIHPFSYSSENKHYSRGSEPVTAEIDGWNAGLTICYDLRFPELYRMYGRKRSGLIINIANWPDSRIYHWKTLLRARAIENQAYIAGVNRTGKDPYLNYPGASCIIGPMGEEIAAAEEGELILKGTISGTHLNETRNRFPFLEDMHLI